jgi:hypothetical protein
MPRAGSAASLLLIGVAAAVLGATAGGSVSQAQPPSGSGPLVGLRVDVEDSAYAPVIAQAIASAQADGVGIYLPWGEIEPKAPTVDGTHTYRWRDSPFEKTVDALTAAGVDILTVRVTLAPDWAVKGGECRVTGCPPTPGHYTDFRRFVQAAIERYGPGGPSGADVRHWSLWNEPNKAFAWSGKGTNDGSYRRYSDLLAQFHAAAVGASNQVAVDAGEIAAGGPSGQNAPRAWAVRFYRYNKSKGRNRDFDFVTIHAYSQRPSDVAAKLRAYQHLFKGHPVAVTEFGWAVGRGSGPGRWRCVAGDQAQAAKLTRAVRAVRADPRLTQVPWLIWFAGIDDDLANDPHPRSPKCRATSWYTHRVRNYIDPFGLYMREHNGSAATLFPRQTVDAFRAAATDASPR